MKAQKIDEIKKLLSPKIGRMRMIRQLESDLFTDLIESKPIAQWQKEYEVILTEPAGSCLCLLYNFDLPSEAIELLGNQNRTPRDEIRLDELINETINQAKNEIA